MFGECLIKCAICGRELDYHKRYGRDVPCCGKDCHDVFDMRRAVSIVNPTKTAEDKPTA